MRQTLGISRIQRIRNEVIREKLGQRETIVQRNEKANMVRTCHKIEDNTDPKYVVTLQHRGKPNQGKTKKQWIDNVKHDLEEKTSRWRRHWRW